MKKIAGVAHLPARKDWFLEHSLPSLVHQMDQVFVYINSEVMGIYETYPEYHNVTYVPYSRDLGDAGKFLGYEMARHSRKPFTYFSCDDDLAYPANYATKMQEWLSFYNHKAVVSLHGSIPSKPHISSYYHDRIALGCLEDIPMASQVTFPGTGVMAFTRGLISPELRHFPLRNMADIWIGFLLSKEKIPAIVLPHSRDYLRYNETLPLQDTIAGLHFNNDEVQTAIVNDFMSKYPLYWVWKPGPLGKQPEPFGQV